MSSSTEEAEFPLGHEDLHHPSQVEVAHPRLHAQGVEVPGEDVPTVGALPQQSVQSIAVVEAGTARHTHPSTRQLRQPTRKRASGCYAARVLGYYDRAGSPISIDEFVELSRDLNARDRRHVARTRVTDPEGREYHVSTVWLGTDHQYVPGGPILIYETMVFGPLPWSESCWRYSSDEEAGRWHQKVVEAIKQNGDFAE